MNYELGQFDERAYNHGRKVVDEMRQATGIQFGKAHFVSVAVYVDGFLQFAGADATIDIHGVKINRLMAKTRAAIILGRMNPNGDVSIYRGERPRPATEAEVDSGVAVWCAACAASCPDAGKDCLVVCKQFKEAKA